MNNPKSFGVYILTLVVGMVIGWQLSNHWPVTSDQDSGQYIATVNDKGLELDWFINQMKKRGGLKAGQYQSTAQKNNLLQFLIHEEVMYQKALESGWDQDPTIQQLVKKTVVDRYLDDTLQKKLAAVRVSEAEMQQHFSANQMQYNQPQRRRAAIILAEFNENDDAETKSKVKLKLQEALAEVETLDEKTKHFGSLALSYSDERTSKYQGGVIGWLIDHPNRKYKWPDEVVKSLFQLEETGDISPILETEKGFYLVRLVDAEKVREKTFNQVKKGIKNQLMQQKQKSVREQFISDLIAEAQIVVNEEVLAQVPTLSEPASNDDKKPPALPQMGGAQ